MKILMCNSFFYIRGGAERCFFDLSALLASHGHEVIPFCMSHERNFPSEYSQYFVSYIDYPGLLAKKSDFKTKLTVMSRVFYSREAKTKIKNLIDKTKPDIAHIHGIAHEISPSILDAIKDAGIPIVQTLHDYKLLCPNTSFISREEICERCKRQRYFQVVLRRCKRDSISASSLAGMEMYFHKFLRIYEKNVDAFIAPSRFIQNKMVEYRIDIPIAYIPNFVDLERYIPCYEPSNYFIFFGRLVRIKGLITLLKAMKYVDSYRLYIAGEGELKGDLQKYAGQLGLSNVTFLGQLSTHELIPLIQSAAFVVFPSEWYENCPMTVLESFACGKPVVGSNLGGLPELIRDGHNGLLFDQGNAQQLASKINSLIKDSQGIIDMGRNGRYQVERFNNPQYHYQQTIKLYQSLLGKN